MSEEIRRELYTEGGTLRIRSTEEEGGASGRVIEGYAIRFDTPPFRSMTTDGSASGR